ncbi:DUF4350 domain-containing protein [Seonamhaeicola maritimus]|uniref:DUF4350 domain-containing protein n=1 Tax=Seonamhaeicola maritimus TaxID=2591822 RepID=A0A5C7GLF0_9FLAO|nr:DUF4350 domain-containing protein [Seonamhaeicola maritimus]TXG39132.1 DUF4350 domain-containing protein [Seonamhaeicola maritimus]
MNKTIKVYIGLLLLLFTVVIAIDFSKPKPINWTPSYNELHKRPYGAFILHDQLKKLFPESEIKNIKVTPYEYFDDLYNWEDSTYNTSGSFMLIQDFTEVDEVSAQELLDFTSHGNDVFIASNYPPQKILDTLSIDIKNQYDFKGKAQLNFANPTFKKDSITIEKGLSNYYFSELDSLATTVLGYQKFDSINRINYVKIEHGLGNVFIHLQPVVFTNYHLLKKENKKYAAAVLSYLNDDTIHFDSKNKIGADLSRSPLRFILSKPALRSAWYLALITLILFMIFNAKRRQRIIKIIKPLENSTIAFTKTIGNLYYETKDHNTIIEKKITYFLEHLRREFYLDTQLLDEKFVKNLSLKSNKDKEYIQLLVTLIIHLKAKSSCTEVDLLKLNKAIEDFYTK